MEEGEKGGEREGEEVEAWKKSGRGNGCLWGMVVLEMGYVCTYVRTYVTPVVRYFRFGRSGLALGVFILPPISSFIRMLYLLHSSVNISICHSAPI